MGKYQRPDEEPSTVVTPLIRMSQFSVISWSFPCCSQINEPRTLTQLSDITAGSSYSCYFLPSNVTALFILLYLFSSFSFLKELHSLLLSHTLSFYLCVHSSPSFLFSYVSSLL